MGRADITTTARAAMGDRMATATAAELSTERARESAGAPGIGVRAKLEGAACAAFAPSRAPAVQLSGSACGPAAAPTLAGTCAELSGVTAPMPVT